MNRRAFVIALGATALTGRWLAAQSPRYEGPLFDAHSHGRGRTYGPEELARALRTAGIDRMAMFGAPAGFDPPNGIMPVIHATNTINQPQSEAPPELWTAAVRAQLVSGAFRGLKARVRHAPWPLLPKGADGTATSPQIRAIAALAVETKRPLTVHIEGPDISDLDELLTEHPTLQLVIAHAGQKAVRHGAGVPLATLERMLSRHINLHTDLSALTPNMIVAIPFEQWSPLILAHPTRFLFGLDISDVQYPQGIARDVAYWRSWLGRLPLDVAERIGYKNAARLYPD